MDEDHAERLRRKTRETPFMPIGIAGFIAALGYGAYKYKHRGGMSRSLFFVQLRVGAQSMVVGSLCIGIIFSMVNRVLKSQAQKDQ